MKVKRNRRNAAWPRREDYVPMFFRYIPRAVRDSFKAECTRRGVSMNAVIVEFMTNVARGEK